MKYQLDLTALACPIPLLTAKKALHELAPNDELMLIVNRQSAVENFAVFAQENDCSLESADWQTEKEFVVRLKKTNLSP